MELRFSDVTQRNEIAPSLQVPQGKLNGALGSLVWLGTTSPWVGTGWAVRSFSSQPFPMIPSAMPCNSCITTGGIYSLSGCYKLHIKEIQLSPPKALVRQTATGSHRVWSCFLQEGRGGRGGASHSRKTEFRALESTKLHFLQALCSGGM